MGIYMKLKIANNKKYIHTNRTTTKTTNSHYRTCNMCRRRLKQIKSKRERNSKGKLGGRAKSERRIIG